MMFTVCGASSGGVVMVGCQSLSPSPPDTAQSYTGLSTHVPAMGTCTSGLLPLNVSPLVVSRPELSWKDATIPVCEWLAIVVHVTVIWRLGGRTSFTSHAPI